MNRVNKFKVWNNLNKAWVVGNEFKEIAFSLDHENSIFAFEDGVWTYLQSTNLKDKNNKEIYEGDILKLADGAIGPLLFHKLSLLVKISQDEYRYLSGRESYSEVIGNIFENPELLTSNEKSV